jgi:hypothetical protein
MKPPPMAKPLTAAMTGFSRVARHERILNGRPLASGSALLQRFLHVLAGAEASTGAGEDRDLELLAVAELDPGLGELGSHS